MQAEALQTGAQGLLAVTGFSRLGFLRAQHLLACPGAEGNPVDAGTGLQGPESSGIVRIVIQFCQVGLTLFHNQNTAPHLLFFRYRASNLPQTLNTEEQARWHEHCVRRLHEGTGGVDSLQVFFDRIDALNESADERGQEILSALYDYAEHIAPEM